MTGREREPVTMLRGNPEFNYQDESCQVSEVSHDVFVDLALERLPVILRGEHRAGKKSPFPGCSCYERALRGNSACTTEVHSIWVPSLAISQKTADLSWPWHQLSNAVSTVIVIVSVEQR